MLPPSCLAFPWLTGFLGKFLEACRAYGVNDKDLFVTVDLFEERNVRGVISCLDNLKNLAHVKGFRV